jgi:hypothetical protein
MAELVLTRNALAKIEEGQRKVRTVTTILPRRDWDERSARLANLFRLMELFSKVKYGR